MNTLARFKVDPQWGAAPAPPPPACALCTDLGMLSVHHPDFHVHWRMLNYWLDAGRLPYQLKSWGIDDPTILDVLAAAAADKAVYARCQCSAGIGYSAGIPLFTKSRMLPHSRRLADCRAWIEKISPPALLSRLGEKVRISSVTPAEPKADEAAEVGKDEAW